MLIDPDYLNRLIKSEIKPLQKQIKKMNAEIEALKQVKNIDILAVIGEGKLLKKFRKFR